MEKIQQLAEFMCRLSMGDDSGELREKYKELLAITDQTDLAMAHQTMLETGLPVVDFCKLCEKITNFMGDPILQFRNNLSVTHPIQKIFYQHKRCLSILDELENLNKAIVKLHPAWTGCPEYKRIRNLGADVDWMDHHTMAEQNVLVPEIEAYGNLKLTQIIKYQHLDLDESYRRLKTLISNLANFDFETTKGQFNSIVQWLVPVGRMHIVVEENVFYPIANNLIKNPTAWEQFFSICKTD
jgi:DUF438 domain-containing protein